MQIGNTNREQSSSPSLSSSALPAAVVPSIALWVSRTICLLPAFVWKCACVCVSQAPRLPTVVVFRETRPEREDKNKDLMILLRISEARRGTRGLSSCRTRARSRSRSRSRACLVAGWQSDHNWCHN